MRPIFQKYFIKKKSAKQRQKGIDASILMKNFY